MNLDEKRSMEKERLTRLKARQPKTDDFGASGVVLSDGIRFYCKQFDLIDPLREENLHPASYKLRIGDQYAIAGEIKSLSDRAGENELVIPPFEVAIIKTRETISMPRFLIGRWNIQVKRAYRGLVWVGGPQVDPGYVGYLFCPIHNLSNNPVRLQYEDTIAVIDFVKTTEFHENASTPYHKIPELVLFEEYPMFRSGLADLVQKDIGGFRNRVDSIESATRTEIETVRRSVQTLTAVTYTALSVLVAALAVVATSNLRTAVSLWTWFAVGFAVLALLVALGK